MIQPLTTKSFIDQVTRERDRMIKEAENINAAKLKGAQEKALNTVREAKKKAAEMLNKIIEHVYLFGLDRYLQLDSKGEVIEEGNLPGGACTAIDAVHGKVYFISEIRFKPIPGAPLVLGKWFGPYAADREVEVSLYSMDFNGRNVKELNKMTYKAPGGRPAAGALAFQAVQNQLLWLRPDGVMVSMDPQGGSFQELGKALPEGPTPSYDLVVSQSSAQMFWCFGKESDEKGWEYEIWRSDMGLSNAKLIVPAIYPQSSTPLPNVKIGIDELGQLYWNSHRAIEVSNLDGADRRTLYTLETHAQGIEIETSLKKLYWTEDDYRLMSGSLDGSGPMETTLYFLHQHTFIQNLSIHTKADQAAGVLFEAQMKRQRAMDQFMEEKAKAQKEADVSLAPFEEKLQDAQKERDKQLTPVLEETNKQRQQAQDDYNLKKQQADEQIKAAEDQKQASLNEAQSNNENQIKYANNHANKRIKDAQEELDKARAQ